MEQSEIKMKLDQVPFDVDSLTYTQIKDFYDKHGRENDREVGKILLGSYEKEFADDELNKLIAIDKQKNNEAISWLSFWTRIPANELEGYPDIQFYTLEYQKMIFNEGWVPFKYFYL